MSYSLPVFVDFLCVVRLLKLNIMNFLICLIFKVENLILNTYHLYEHKSPHPAVNDSVFEKRGIRANARKIILMFILS